MTNQSSFTRAPATRVEPTPSGSIPFPDSLISRPSHIAHIGPKKLVELQRKRDAVYGGAFLVSLYSGLMWIVDGGPWNIVSIATAWEELSKVTSLVGTALLLLMLLFTSRAAWLDQIIGHDRMTGAHKRLGKPAFYLIAAHFFASWMASVSYSNQSAWAELVSLTTGISDMVLATIGIVLMAAVVATSIRLSRKALSYEGWHLVHLLSYFSIAFSIPHIFSMGSDLVGQPIHYWSWVFGFVFVGVNILTYRIALPLINSLSRGIRVKSITPASSDSFTITLSGSNIESLGAHVGQFFVLRFLNKNLWKEAHPFSLAAVPTDRALKFTVAVRGDGTSYLPHVPAGTRVILEGPYGVFTEESRTKQDVVLIGAGVGIVPLRAIAQGFASQPGDITVIYRNRDADDAPLLDDIKTISEINGHRFHFLPGSRVRKGTWLTRTRHSDEETLLALAPHVRKADVYICGPISFMEAAQDTLRRLRVPAHQIHVEEYAW